jgi:zinc protease
VESAFQSWAPGNEPVPPLPTFERLSTIKRVSESRDKKQAVILLGFPGVRMNDDNRFALDMLQEACSDLGSRLFLRIREKLGLAYYVGAQSFTGLVPGYFAFYAGTAPEKLELVEQELLKEIHTLRLEGVTAAELKRAKAKVVGQKKIGRQDLGSYAMTVTLDELYGLGYKRTDLEDAQYEAVTLAEVQAAAVKYLTPDSYVVSIVKPE